jgi:uncharacterized protein YcsI (UPF0317 family)
MSNPITPTEFRHLCRAGQLDRPTPGLVPGYVQANLVILPVDLAFEFLLFCLRNPKPCPILDVTEVGDPEPKLIALGADIRTDLSRYCIFRHGQLIEEKTDICEVWRDDLVAFLIGCSFSFETAMLNAGLSVRHIEERKNVPMYKTSIDCLATRTFSSPLVVSMRPFTPQDAIRAVEITSRFAKAHGSPIHISNPEQLGIADLSRPDYGDTVTIREGEVPVFWACGVTTQTAITRAKPEFAITHAPGHMFISDWRDEALAS